MPGCTTRRLLALITLPIAAVLGGTSATASAVPSYAPEGEASITPGAMMYTDGAQCTANFVFRDAAGRHYVGYAAHCAGLGEATDTNGCSIPSLPLGTRVRFAEGGNLADGGTTVGHGRLAYSSWLSMQAAGESGVNPCTYNDFALVRVAKGSRAEVNPTVPFFGGPTKVDRSGTEAGDQVFSYGNSSIRGGVEQLSPKFGFSVGDTGGGWSHTVSTLTPGIPGDSGSGFLDDAGRALGTLSTLNIAPTPASNGVGDLGRELDYAQAHSGLDGLRLVPGTREFTPLAPAGLPALPGIPTL